MLGRYVLAALLAQSGFHLFTALLPFQMAQLGAADLAIGVVVGLGGLTQVPAALGMGRLTSRVGVEIVLRIALLCYAIGSVLIFIGVSRVDVLVPATGLGRSLHGVGYGLLIPASLTLVASLAIGPARSKSLGATASAMHVAFIVFPPMALLLHQVGGIVLVVSVALVLLGLSFVGFRDGGRDGRAAAPVSNAIAPLSLGLLVHVGIGLHLAMQGVLFTRLPIYADPQIASLFFVAIGIGVVSARLLLSRVPAADSTVVLVVSTILCVVGLVVLAVTRDAVVVPLTGLLMGAASGLMMQLLTEWLTGGPAYHHAVHLSRFSAAMAIGLGVGSIASSSFPVADPIRGPIPALAATAMVAACCAAVGKRHLDTANQRPRAT